MAGPDTRRAATLLLGGLGLLLFATVAPAGAQRGGGGDRGLVRRLAPAAGSVLHGAGHTMAAWETDFAEYRRDVSRAPVVYSTYMSMARMRDPRQLEAALQTITRDGLVPMVCFTNSYSRMETRFRWLRWGATKDEEIVAGTRDAEIVSFAEVVARVPGPVIVRFMQEAAHGAHHDEVRGPETMRRAWRHFAGIVRRIAPNAELAYHPQTSSRAELEAWWPGDEYVDWLAGSIYGTEHLRWAAMEARFAAEHGIPYMVAEAAPTHGEFRRTGATVASAWERFFVPLFRLIDETPNFKLLIYNSMNWPQTKSNPGWPDTRIGTHPEILRRYDAELSKPRWVHGRR